MKTIYKFCLWELSLLILGAPLYYIWLNESERSRCLLSESSWMFFLTLIPVIVFGLTLTHPSISRTKPLKRIFEMLKKSFLHNVIMTSSTSWLLILSLSAGFSEELLFRGVLQVKWGLWAASLLFGAAHFLTPLYFILATAIGLYLGYVYEVTQCLIVPILLHALYDFFVLLRYKKMYQRKMD